MEKLKCPQCGKEFEKTGQNHKFCSISCGKKYRYRKLNGERSFKPQKVSKKDLDEIKRLYENGIPKKQIYKQYNIHPDTLNKYLSHILTAESDILRKESQAEKTKKKRDITNEKAEKYIKTILASYISPDNPAFINSIHISVLYEDLGYSYADGKSLKELAELFDLPEEVVKKTFSFLSKTDFYVDRKALKQAESQKCDDIVKQCYECSMPRAVIADKTGFALCTISRKSKKLALTDSRVIRESKQYEELKNIYDMYINGYTQKNIENRTGLSIPQIALRMKKFRLLTPTDELERLEKTMFKTFKEEDWETIRNSVCMGDTLQGAIIKHGKGRSRTYIQNGLISRYGADYKYRS